MREYHFLCIQYLLFLFHVASQKLEHRINALEKTTWCSETKEEVGQVLTMEYTSSDESSYECDSDREEAELAAYKVKHLSWERTKFI